MAKDILRVKNRIRETNPSKNNALYNSNMYWSQKPYNICDILIEELSEEGDTVFDPFMGSGVTILESVKKEYHRKAIGCEINEAPLFLVRTLLSDYNVAEYKKTAKDFLDRLAGLKKYYETECPECGNVGVINTVRFDLERRNDVPKIKEIKYTCPICKRAAKEAGEKDYKLQNRDYEITNVPKMKMIENSKLAVYKDETIDEIFTKRNFKVLDEIVGIIKDYPQYEAVFNYILMSILHLCKITDTHSNSQWPLWIPKTDCIEKNIIEIFSKRIKKFTETIEYIDSNYDAEKEALLINKGSQNITSDDIPDGTVNLIITDPPYLGQVAYSEYMQLYKPFLGKDFNLQDEIIVTSTPDRKMGEDEYFKLLDDVFKMCDEKMVCGGYFCMYFHDSNLSVWNNLIQSMARHHFKYLSQEHIKKTNTLKNIISPKKSMSGDALLLFVKERFRYKEIDPAETIEEIEENLRREIVDTVKIKGALSTTELYDGGLIEYLVYNGWLDIISKKYKTLVEVFETCLEWDEETNKWKEKSPV